MTENNQPQSPQTKREPWGFCETPEEKCTMNYCDDNGCINRKRNLVSSHSPTEQPGDAKHTPTPWIPWETPMVHQGKYFQCPVESAHPDGIINVAMAFGVTREECKANADLIARAPDLLSEVSTLRSKQAELIAENREIRMLLNDCRQIKLAELQSENARLREALEVIIKLDCLSHGLHDAEKIAKSALSGGSKQ